jgi:hypothetical protein
LFCWLRGVPEVDMQSLTTDPEILIVTAATTSGGELIAGEMAVGSGTVQMLAGLTAIVLGVLAVAGTNPRVLSPTFRGASPELTP